MYISRIFKPPSCNTPTSSQEHETKTGVRGRWNLGMLLGLGKGCLSAEQAYLYIRSLHHDGIPERGSQLVLLIILQHAP